jgi:hypothetical protein
MSVCSHCKKQAADRGFRSCSLCRGTAEKIRLVARRRRLCGSCRQRPMDGGYKSCAICRSADRNRYLPRIPDNVKSTREWVEDMVRIDEESVGKVRVLR